MSESLAVQKKRSSGNLRSQERAGGGSLAVQKKRSSGNHRTPDMTTPLA